MEQMEVGDALKSPYYSIEFNPTMMRKNPGQITALAEVMNQVRGTPSSELIFYKRDIGTDETADSDPKARQIYNLWIQDVSKFQDPKASTQNLPNATIGYAPVYGPTGKKTLGKDKAAYVISFSPEWLRTLQSTTNKPGIIDANEFNDYTTITISFPQTKDINPRRVGQYNFSAVYSNMVSSPQKQYVQSIDAGGKIRFYQDANSNIIMETTPLQFNKQTAGFDPMSPIRMNITQMQNERGETIGFYDKIYQEELSKMYSIAQQNNFDQNNNKKTKLKK
jgi:hypothetical protein